MEEASNLFQESEGEIIAVPVTEYDGQTEAAAKFESANNEPNFWGTIHTHTIDGFNRSQLQGDILESLLRRQGRFPKVVVTPNVFYLIPEIPILGTEVPSEVCRR